MIPNTGPGYATLDHRRFGILCHVYTRARGVITEYPDERAADFAVIASRPRQAYFMFGIGAAFMVRYHLATGDSQARDDAAVFLLPALNATDAMYETAQIGKVAWGAALLFGITSDRIHRELALALRWSAARTAEPRWQLGQHGWTKLNRVWPLVC